MTFDLFLEKYTDHRDTFLQLRRFILDMHPGIVQTTKWGLPVFVLKKNIAYFDVQKGRPLIGIMYTYQIPEIQPMLVQGKRTQIGHFYLEKMTDKKWSDVITILQLAVEHDLKR